ncbi:type II toxin-antitoxin system Phd/YefM family antitoxin [Sanguibacter suarezii]|uniref:type II toxin-antitoxin system Phd/YefM family antitoxin n=1 Tax=Sanguibacter suarezii TaxID=60921 RepID=UPI000AF1D4D2|nr:type II toxin-antitoxin system Phd/YefM family antitoxin [Sanguibacter suarezii]
MSTTRIRADVVQRTVASSDLARSPAAVFASAEDGPVTITRRDGEPFVLTTKKRDDETTAILHLAAQLIAVSLAENSAPFTVRLRTPFPWIAVLSPEDQDSFADEILTTARACFSLGQMDSLLHTVHAWHETAAAVAEGWDRAPVDWLDESTPVDDPRGLRTHNDTTHTGHPNPLPSTLRLH